MGQCRMGEVHVGDVVEDNEGTVFTVEAIREYPERGTVQLFDSASKVRRYGGRLSLVKTRETKP